MNADPAFLSQARRLARDLESLLAMIHDPALGGLGQRVIDRLGQRIRSARDDAIALLDQTAVDSRWTSLNRQKRASQEIIDETNELIHGVLLRLAGLDGGIASIADVLISDLAARTDTRWSRLTIFGDEDHTTPTTEIVRMRFPSVSVWSLPNVAHEFGHSLVDLLNDIDGRDRPRPIKHYLDRLDGPEPPVPVARPHAEELFCDLFALYAMGPAVALSLATYELNPEYPHEASDSHPSAADRFHFLSMAVDRLGRHGSAVNRYGSIGQRLAEWWTAALRATGQKAEPASEALETLLDDLLDLIRRHGGPQTAYDSFDRAQQLDAHWDAGLGDQSIADVVNAAWLRRLRLPSSNWLELEAEALERARQAAFHSTPEG